jgi:hypothetical protein
MDANRAVFCARWFTEAKSAAVRLADLIIILIGICVTGQNDYQQNKENPKNASLRPSPTTEVICIRTFHDNDPIK